MADPKKTADEPRPPTPDKLTPLGAPVDTRFPGQAISGTPQEATGQPKEEKPAHRGSKSEDKEKEKENDKGSTRHR